MARAIHKPNIIQHNNGPRNKVNRQLGRRPQPHPFFYPLTPTIVTTMSKESDADGDVPSRKRISLACQRCRKRKIKCEPSNDAEDGQACVACQSAKSPDCQYLRVSSGVLHCASPESPIATWGFSMPTHEDSPLSAVPAHDLSQYSISNPSQMALSTGRSAYRSSISNEAFARTSSLSAAVSPQRNFQPIPNTDTPGPVSYNVQPTHNGFPFHQNGGSPTVYPMNVVSPTWAPPSACGMPSMDTAFAQNNTMEYDPLQYQGSTYAEEPPYFPGLSPLSTHLPAPASAHGKERYLPAPVQTCLAPNPQCFPETESYNSSSGGTESSSEVSMYEYSSFGSNSLVGVPMSLPNLRDPSDVQCFDRLPSIGPNLTPRQEFQYPVSSIETSEDDLSRAQDIMPSRSYRMLQPQPCRSSRSFLNSPGVAAGRDVKKSAAVRRQERHSVHRHQ